jgi:hypothetical protein
MDPEVELAVLRRMEKHMLGIIQRMKTDPNGITYRPVNYLEEMEIMCRTTQAMMDLRLKYMKEIQTREDDVVFPIKAITKAEDLPAQCMSDFPEPSDSHYGDE